MVEIYAVLNHSLKITAFVFAMMVAVDYVNVLSRGRLRSAIRGGVWRQYTIASFLGATPGCLGVFMNVSLYVHGFLTFGAIVGGMIATSGDEAFVMLSLFPGKALMLFGILFVLGVIFAWITDKAALQLKIVPCQECRLQEYHPEQEAPRHYIKEHIWEHILKQHLWRVFLWMFFALLFLEIGFKHWNLEGFVKAHTVWVLLISAIVAIVPESGPHLLFAVMFARGLIPFSVLLTSSFVQDGHGMLPLLSYTIKDSILIKMFNLAFGLGIGIVLYSLGL